MSQRFDWADPFELHAQLTEEERLVHKTAASYAQDRLAPRVLELTELLVDRLGVTDVGAFLPKRVTYHPTCHGLRLLGLTGTLSEPIGSGGSGVVVPFLNALYPSRMCADYAEDVYRITVQNNAVPTQPILEYWYNFQSQQWTGPHTCGMRLISSYPGASSFLGIPWAANGVAWQSGVLPVATARECLRSSSTTRRGMEFRRSQRRFRRSWVTARR